MLTLLAPASEAFHSPSLRTSNAEAHAGLLTKDVIA